MLSCVFFRMRSKETTLAIRCCPADCIELMIAEYGNGRFGLAHGTGDPQNLSLFRPAINKITNEDCLSNGVSEHASKFVISKLNQQSAKGVCVPVDVTDYVVTLVRHSAVILMGTYR